MSVGQTQSVWQHLTHYFRHDHFIGGAVLQTSSSAASRQAAPKLPVAQQLHALCCAFLRAAPENRIFIFPVKIAVFRSALRAENPSQMRYFEGTRRRQITILF
jgi:hypothetical protein